MKKHSMLIVGTAFLVIILSGSVFAQEEADVQLTKTTSNPMPNVGQQFTFTVTAINNGPLNATGVVVTDPIPAGLTFNSATPSQGTYDPSTGIWNIGIIPNTGNATLDLFVTPTASAAGTTITNIANKTAQDQFDPTTPDIANVSVFVPLAAPTQAANITIGTDASILSPNQSQHQDPVQAQTQASINENINSLTNNNVNLANSSSIAVKSNNMSNNNTFNPVVNLNNSNDVG